MGYKKIIITSQLHQINGPHLIIIFFPPCLMMEAAVFYLDDYLSFQAPSLIHLSNTTFQAYSPGASLLLSAAEVVFLAAISPQSSLIRELFFNPSWLALIAFPALDLLFAKSHSLLVLLPTPVPAPEVCVSSLSVQLVPWTPTFACLDVVKEKPVFCLAWLLFWLPDTMQGHSDSRGRPPH